MWAMDRANYVTGIGSFHGAVLSEILYVNVDECVMANSTL